MHAKAAELQHRSKAQVKREGKRIFGEVTCVKNKKNSPCYEKWKMIEKILLHFSIVAFCVL